MKKFILLLTVCTACMVLRAQKLQNFHPDETIPVKFLGESKPLRDLPESNAQPLKGAWPVHDNPTLENKWLQNLKPNPEALPKGTDPALQTNYNLSSSAAVPTVNVLSNWAGLSASVSPSDNTLAVSTGYVMQMTNNNTSTYIRVWNKTGTVLVDKKLVSSITGINDYGDPNIVYDWQADRFVFTVLYGASASKLVVCVSATNDPSGAWYTYSFATANGFPDYPKIGVWGNSYFITTNSNTPTVFALNRSTMLSGSGTGTAQVFKLSRFNVGFQSSSPVTFTGTMAAPAAMPAMVIRPADDSWGGTTGSDHLEIFQLTIDWVNAANSVISGPLNFNTTAWASNAGNAPMPGTTRKLDALADVIMDKVQYIKSSLGEFITCSVVSNADGTGKAAPRWYILKKTGANSGVIDQQSTYSPDAASRFMSSISMNSRGTVALGYNISSSSIYPGIRITGRAFCDAANTMTVAETSIKSGAAANSSTRYGDYNALVVDPVDGSFWLTANYNQTAAWSTSVSHFTISPCPQPQDISVGSNRFISMLKAMPIPASTSMNINFVSEKGTKAMLVISDLYGNNFINKEVEIAEGTNNFSVDVSSLTNGKYILQIQSAGSEAARLSVEIRH